MKRTRITAVVLVAVILASKWGLDQSAAHQITGPLEGTWEITSVQREGVADPRHVSSHLIFTGSGVTLQSWFAALGGIEIEGFGTGIEILDAEAGQLNGRASFG